MAAPTPPNDMIAHLTRELRRRARVAREGRRGLEAVAMANEDLDPRDRAFYQHALMALSEAGVRFLVGGAYAFACYTGIARHTKDLDIFVRPEDSERALERLEAAGYRVERTHPHWLGKAFCEDAFMDVIYSSGNGVARVDDEWFAHALEGRVVDVPVLLCPAEEMIWSKAFVMEKVRCDVADVAHIIRERGERLDWQRLLDRFGPHWRVLLAHLVLFGFIYPAERTRVPAEVLRELLRRADAELDDAPADDGVCQGTLLSWSQYLPDVERWGYADARLRPRGPMTAEEIAQWTAAEK
jgi:hypothetical protein